MSRLCGVTLDTGDGRFLDFRLDDLAGMWAADKRYGDQPCYFIEGRDGQVYGGRSLRFYPQKQDAPPEKEVAAP